jgi:GTP cyclohydrolase I
MSQAALSLSALDPSELRDVQAEPPAIAMALDEAGIADLRYPITLHEADGTAHHTIASTSFAASVSADTRGLHMSRFVETLHDWHRQIGVATISRLLADLVERMGATAAVAKFEFTLFLERTAPVSGGGAFVAYDCVLEGHATETTTTCTLRIRVPITSLCPCSREISEYGAHNQRGSVEITASFDVTTTSETPAFADLIAIAEEAGSAPIYSLLKRTDERSVTMQAYENPAFVEDITRAVAEALHRDRRIRAGNVCVVNEESIHSHNAYAAVSWTH